MAVAAESAETTAPAAHTGLTDRAKAERKFAYILCAPAVLVMALVAGFPIVYAFWLSLRREDLRFPDAGEFIGFSNYATVLSSSTWWSAFSNTMIITVVSVLLELALGMLIAQAMYRAIFARTAHPRLRARAVRRGHRRRRVRVAPGVRPGDRVRDRACSTSTRRR